MYPPSQFTMQGDVSGGLGESIMDLGSLNQMRNRMPLNLSGQEQIDVKPVNSVRREEMGQDLDQNMYTSNDATPVEDD